MLIERTLGYAFFISEKRFYIPYTLYFFQRKIKS